MVKYSYLFALFLFTFSISLNAQDKIKKNQKELNDIKNQIQLLENELNDKSRKEKESTKVLENYNKQNKLITKMINKLKKEEEELEESILASETELEKLEREIKTLKENYAKHIVAQYKMGKDEGLFLLLESKSIQQAALRYKYFKVFSDKRKKDITALSETRSKILELNNQLLSDKEQKELVLSLKQQEEDRLKKKLAQQQKHITSIKKDKEQLKKELIAKKDAEKKISSFIANLIAEENRKKIAADKKRKELAEKERKNLLAKANDKKAKPVEKETVIKKDNSIPAKEAPVEREITSGMVISKGALMWPVKGKVVRKFGENRNKELNTVTVNYGIDIEVGGSTNVKAVADGTVSVINWIAGYGNVVIVTHANGFRSVYGHLASINVDEGSFIKKGSSLGNVANSLEGNILHFELWNERANLNPESWLSR